MTETETKTNDWKRTVQLRGTTRTLATKAMNEVKSSFRTVSAQNKEAARMMVARLKARQSEMVELDKIVLDNIKEDQFDSEAEKVFEYRDNLTDAIAFLEGQLLDVEKEEARAPQVGVAPTGAPVHDVRRERVPEMELTTFDGNPLNWEEFWDDFKLTVDSRKDLTVITKFKLLRKCLTGNAAAACKGYQLTALNYDQVKSILEERYGDKETAVALHLEALVKLKPATSHGVAELVRVRDECEAHIRALVILGFAEDTFGQLFAPIILSKLPKFVRLEIRKQKKQSGQAQWTMTHLRETLSTEIELRTSNEHEFFVSDSEGRSDARGSGRDSRGANQGRRAGGTASTLLVNEKQKGPIRGRQGSPVCVFCDGSHYNDQCDQYPDVASRQAKLDEQKRCYRCLRTGHRAAECRLPKKECFHCKKDNHQRALCLAKFGKKNKVQVTHVNSASALNLEATPFAPDNVYAVNTISSSGSGRKRRGMAILESALVMVVGELSSCMARVVLDNGSTKSYISSKLAKRIGAERLGFEITAVGRFGEDVRRTRQQALHRFAIVQRDGTHCDVEMNVEEHVAPKLSVYPVDLEEIEPFCDTSQLAEMVVDKPEEVPIDILLGLDYYYMFVSGKEFRCANGLVLKESTLGYILTGFKQGPVQNLPTSYEMLVIGDRMRDPTDIERFWKLEQIGITDDPSLNDDESALQHFKETAKVEDKRYQVQWPFKTEKPDLPENYGIALKRLNSVYRKLKCDDTLRQKYDETFRDQEKLGIIEKAPPEPDGLVHYICHHAVLTPHKTTTKLRVVFDASVKANEHTDSLNEAMHRGPVFLNDLCGILIRFRLSPVAIVSDVEKAFLQVSLQSHHRDCTRFLWLKDPQKPPTPENLQVYRYARVVFGAKASPFLLAATINDHMSKAGGDVALNIMRNNYVDNVFSGQPTAEAALEYYMEAKLLFSEISMNLREWYSNDQQFMSGVAEPDRGKDLLPSVLGIKWSVERDRISCTSGKLQTCGQLSMRSILSSIASIYDPCGWFGPVTIRGKMLMQQLHSQRKGWNDPADDATVSAWLELASDLSSVSTYSQPRHIGIHTHMTDPDVQLHCFCDASKKAFGAAVYLRVQFGNEIKSNLVFAKSRVAPLHKPMSIPKAELVAALVGSRLVDFVKKEMDVAVNEMHVWSDSSSVLGWIKNPSLKTVFVSNRVKGIKAIPGLTFHYVPSEENPADLLSRGVQLSSLITSDTWWQGPWWLQENENQWPQKEPPGVSAVNEENVDEQVADDLCALNLTADAEVLFDLSRFSKRNKLLRVTCMVLRALKVLVPKFVSKHFSSFERTISGQRITAKELSAAHNFWDRRVQRQHFEKGMQKRTSRVWQTFEKQLGLFTDKSGLLRCRGRFEHAAELSTSSKYPILLPKHSPYTKLVLKEYHEKMMHAGLKQTLGLSRLDYWVPHGRSMVKQVIRACRLCRRHSARPFKLPEPPPLPDFRASIRRPFACVGLDYLGPLMIRTPDSKVKVWIALFTCSVIRAVHLEVVGSLSTADFLLCLRRFVTVYGKPDLIVSDNASQFKMAENVIKKLWLDVLRSDEVQTYSAETKIEWKFITELSPWMGGFYERMIRPVKEALRVCLGCRLVTLVELQTLTAEIASVINSRPLLYAEAEPGEQVLTPAHLMFRSSETFPEVEDVDEYQARHTATDDLIEGWKHGQKILRQYWDCWLKQYLSSLREKVVQHPQRAVSEQEPSIGMTVIIKDKLPRGMWRVGRIKKLIASADGKVRSVEVQLSSGKILVRPLKLLCPLEKSNTGDNVVREANFVASIHPIGGAKEGRKQRPKRRAAVESERLTRKQLSN